ncbi:MAG: VRR-NUC domain-containing protein [Acidobacteria bacterium]|nr:MAG: VRR-NUC domain-containing protein [Acidobacteriota bacterium]
MKNRREAEIQSAIVKALSRLGFLVIHIPNQATRGKYRYSGLLPGAPDLIVIGKNRIVFMEVKRPDGKQTEAQKIVQRIIEENGFEYYIVRSLDDAVSLLGYGEEEKKTTAHNHVR